MTPAKALAAGVLLALVAGLSACSTSKPEGPCTSRGCIATSSACDRAAVAPSSATAAMPALPAPARLPLGAVGEVVRPGPGTFGFTDFTPAPDQQRLGLQLAAVAGNGVGATVFAMIPRTSTAASTIPTRFPHSNRLSLMRASGPRVRLSGFSLVGTDQGHAYNGLRVERTAGARVHDVCVAGVPGTYNQPPGETFGIADYRTTGSVYRRIRVDGRGIGAAGFGANVSSGITVADSEFFDNRYSAGATFWEVDGITLDHVVSRDNGVLGLNFERVQGDVRIISPVTRHNGRGDIRIASDLSSARFTISDPVTDHAGRLTIVLPPTYEGRPNRQRRDDVRVLVHGHDRTAELARFIES